MRPGLDLDLLIVQVVLERETKPSMMKQLHDRPYLMKYDEEWRAIPMYSKVAHHAMEIIEKLFENEWKLKCIPVLESGKECYIVTFSKEKDVESSLSPMFAHAVCLAALKTKGVEFFDDYTDLTNE